MNIHIILNLVKNGIEKAYSVYAWQFTIFYNGVYNIITYDFQKKKPISGFENRNKIKYLTYPFSKFEKYELKTVTYGEEYNNLYFSPNGWHKIDKYVSSHVTVGNNIRAQDYVTSNIKYNI